MLQHSSDDDEVKDPTIITSEEAKQRRQMEKEMKKFQKIENKQNVQDYQENFVTKNYTHINSKVEKLRFKKQEDPSQGKVSSSEKVLINRRVLNDYIHIVNKRQDVVDQMEDNFWTMVQLYDGTLHYFNKYYGKNLESKLEKLKRILKPEHRYLLNSIDKNEKRIKRRILEFQNVKNSNDPMLKKALEECQNIEEIVNKNHEAIRQRIIDRHNKLKSESHIEKLSKKKGYLVNEREIDQNRQNQIVMNEVQKFGSDRIKLQLFEQDMKTIIENKEIKVKIHKIQQSLDKITAQESATQTKQPDQSIPEIQEPEVSEDSYKIASSLLHTHSPTHDSVHSPSSDYITHKNNDNDNVFQKKSGNPFLDPKEGNSMVLEESVFSRDTSHGRANEFLNSQEELKESFHSNNPGEPPKQEEKSLENHPKNDMFSSFYKRDSKPTGQSQSLHSLIPSSFASHRKLSNKDLHPDHITLSGFPSPPSTSYTSPTRQLVSSSINSRRSFGNFPETQTKEKKEKSKSVVSFAFSSSSFSQDVPQVAVAQETGSLQTTKQTLANSYKGSQPILKVKKQLAQNKSVIDLGTQPNKPYIQLKHRKASFDQTAIAPENRIITSPFDKPHSIQTIQQPLKPALKKKLSVITAQESHQKSTIEGFQTLDTLQNSQLLSQKLNTLSSQPETQKQMEENSKQKLKNLFNFDRLISQTPNPIHTKESKLRRQITMIPNEYSSFGAQSSSKLLKRKIGSMDFESSYSLNNEEQKTEEIPIIEWNAKAKKEKEVKIIEPLQEEQKEEEEDKSKKKEEGAKEKKKPKRGQQNLFDKKDNAKKLAASMSKPLLRNKIYNESDIFKYKKINQFVISEYYEKKILNLQKDEIPLLTAKELEDIENEKMKKSLLNSVSLQKQVSHRHLFWNNVEAKKADFLSLEKQPDLVIGAEAEEKYEQEVTRKLGSAISNLYRDLQKECSDQMHQSKTFSKDIIMGEKELIEDHKKLKHEYSELLGPKVYKSVYVEQILNQTKKQLNIKLHNKRPKLSSPERILQNLLKQEKKLNAWGKTLRQATTEEPGEKKYSLIAKSVAPSSSQEVKKSKREQSLEEINKYIEKVQNSQHQASLKKQLEQLMNLDSNRKAMFEMTQHRFMQRNTTRDRSKNKYISELMQKNNIDPNTFDQIQQELSKKQPQAGVSDQSQKPIIKQDIQPVVVDL